MGQFSWMFADTDNKQALCEGHPAYVALPFGGSLYEESYDGYGRFAGHDIYDLVADWNREFLSKNPDYLIPSHSGYWKNDDEWVAIPPRPVRTSSWYPAYADLSLTPEQVVEKSGLYEYRHIGIDIACYDDQNKKLPFPIKICKDRPYPGDYFFLPPSNGDPNQGWGEPDDNDEEEYE